MTTLIIGKLCRDLTNKRSVVTLTWEDESEKRLGLILPFDCAPENLKAETEKAVRALDQEQPKSTASAVQMLGGK